MVVPETIVDDLMAAITSIGTGFQSVTIVFIGVTVSFFIARKLIQLIPSK